VSWRKTGPFLALFFKRAAEKLGKGIKAHPRILGFVLLQKLQSVLLDDLPPSHRRLARRKEAKRDRLIQKIIRDR